MTFQTTISPKFLFLCVVVVVFIYALGDARVPLLFSGILAYLTFPLVTWLQGKGIRREVSTILIFLMVVLPIIFFLLATVPNVVVELARFLQDLPEKSLQLVDRLSVFAEDRGLPIPYNHDEIAKIVRDKFSNLSGEMLTTGVAVLRSSFMTVPAAIVGILNVLLIPVFYLYLSNDYEEWKTNFSEALPPEAKFHLRRFSDKTGHILGGYLRGQLIACLVLGALYGAGLELIGLRYGWLIGMLTGFFSFVPYLGFSGGFLVALVMAFTQEGGNVVLSTIVVMTVVQVLESFVITPRLVGNSVGLSGLEALLALIVFGNLFGIIGILFAIPMAAFVKELLILIFAPQKLPVEEA